MLSHIFLASVDNILASLANEDTTLKIFRDVDDFLVLLKKSSTGRYGEVARGIVQQFGDNGKGLSFTYMPVQKKNFKFWMSRALVVNHQCHKK